jgi:hypothetical protein
MPYEGLAFIFMPNQTCLIWCFYVAICGITNVFFFFFISFGFSLLNVDLGQEIVNAICDDDDIKAISFVGPNAVSYSLSLTLIQVAVCYHYIDVVKMYNLVITSNSVVHIQYLLLLCCPSPLLYGLKVIQRE